MATVFESRPRATCAPPPRSDEGTVNGAFAALEAAARQIYDVADARPEARRRAADLLTLYARRLHALDTEETY